MSEAAELVGSCKPASHPPNGIPGELSFERIIQNGTCSPCTLRDFMNYLQYIEHAAEHLQFFLWFQSYRKRFELLSQADKSLSPEWTLQNQRDAVEDWKRTQAKNPKQPPHVVVNEVFEGTIFPSEGSANHGDGMPIAGLRGGNPFLTTPSASERSPRSSSDITSARNLTPIQWGCSISRTTTQNSIASDAGSQASKASSTIAHETFANAGLAQPFRVQPFRREIELIIRTYLANDSPRELNLSSSQRKTLLKALESTTHPSALVRVSHDMELVLRQQLHPNFIRWSICNGNPPRGRFIRLLAVSLIVIGIAVELLIALSSMNRGYRALGAVPLFIGVATLTAAAKGLCVALHGLRHRQLRPWELYADTEDDKGLNGGSHNMRTSIESIETSNSYEDAPWVVKYDKRNIIRKIFDREYWVAEPALRRIQDMILVQSILIALAVTFLITAAFVAVPEHAYIW